MDFDPRNPPPVVPVPVPRPWNGPGGQQTRFFTDPTRDALRASTRAGPGAQEVYEMHRYPSFRGEAVIALASGVSQQVLTAPDTYRNGLILRNASGVGVNVFVSFGTTASANSILRLEPNVMIQFDTSVPQDDIFAFASGGAGTLILAVSTIALPR